MRPAGSRHAAAAGGRGGGSTRQGHTQGPSSATDLVRGGGAWEGRRAGAEASDSSLMRDSH